MALDMGTGGFLSTPLAVVVTGGLFTSTALTLILVPVLYVAFDRLRPKNVYASGAERERALATETAPSGEALQADARGSNLMCGAGAQRAGTAHAHP